MRHLRKYYDESGFTEPVEVVIGSQIGVFYPEGQDVFFPAVDHGDGTYTVTLGGSDVLFEDGLGIYENSDESGGIVPTKLTSGNPVSGTMQNIMDPSGEDWHYDGYEILNSDCKCVVTIKEYNEYISGAIGKTVMLWLGFTNLSPSMENVYHKNILYLNTWDVKETRTNEIITTNDIYLENRWRWTFGKPMTSKLINNGDGTYSEVYPTSGAVTTFSGDGIYIFFGDLIRPGHEAHKTTIGSKVVTFKVNGEQRTGYTYNSPTFACPTGFCYNITGDGYEPGVVYGIYTGTTESAVLINENAYKVTITHPYKQKTEYKFNISNPGVGYIQGSKKVSYNKKAPTGQVTLQISGTSDYACTIPMNGKVLDITQEELRKLAIKFIPDDYVYLSWTQCNLRFDSVVSYSVERDTTSPRGTSMEVESVPELNVLKVSLIVYDIPNSCNDVLHITFSTNDANGEIKV